MDRDFKLISYFFIYHCNSDCQRTRSLRCTARLVLPQYSQRCKYCFNSSAICVPSKDVTNNWHVITLNNTTISESRSQRLSLSAISIKELQRSFCYSSTSTG